MGNVLSNYLSPILLWCTSTSPGTIHSQPLHTSTLRHPYTSSSHVWTISVWPLTFYSLSKPFLPCLDSFISNLIPPSMTIHPSQHPHFSDFHLLNMRILDDLTLCSIQQCWSNCHFIEVAVKMLQQCRSNQLKVRLYLSLCTLIVNERIVILFLKYAMTKVSSSSWS